MINKIKDLYTKMAMRERILLFVAFGAIVLMATDLMILGPVLSHMKILDSEIRDKSHTVQRDLRIISFKDTILREYGHYERYLDGGEKTQDEIITALLGRVETLAIQNEITMVNVTPGEVEEKPIYKVYRTSLEFEGTLPNMISFMSYLEASDNLFKVTRFTLDPKSKTGEVLKCSMDISRVLISAQKFEAETDGAAHAAPGGVEMAIAEVSEAEGFGKDAIEEETLYAEDFQ